MNRARELRSRIKEADCNTGSSDVSSLASKSEIQRQRRSRQLEATQRLLEGQNNFTESSGRSVGSKSFRDEGSTHRVKSDDRSESRVRCEPSSQRYNHSIISQKRLGQIHRRYQTPSDTNSLTSRQNHDANLSRYTGEDDDYTPTKNHSKGIGTMNKLRTTSNDAMPVETTPTTLREMPIEGRGRGRGRGRPRPLGSGGTSSLSELSRSSKSIPCVAMATDQMADSRSRSPSIARINSSSHESKSHQKNGDDIILLSLQSYLRYALIVKRTS